MKKVFMLFMAGALTFGLYSCKQAPSTTEEATETVEEVVEEAVETVDSVATEAVEAVEGAAKDAKKAAEDHSGHNH